MARRRFQKGFVFLQGNQWKGRYREDVMLARETKRIRRELSWAPNGTSRQALAMRRLKAFSQH